MAGIVSGETLKKILQALKTVKSLRQQKSFTSLGTRNINHNKTMSETPNTYDSGAQHQRQRQQHQQQPQPQKQHQQRRLHHHQHQTSSAGQTQAAPSGDLMSQLYTSEGNLAENYTSLLEENGLGELTNTVAKYKSPEGLLKGCSQPNQLCWQEGEGVIVPNEGSTEQEIAEYRQAIGVPESPTAYELPAPENMPEGMGWDDGLAGEWQNVFHEAGLSQEQAAKLSQAYSDITNNQFEQANQTLSTQAESEMEQQRAELQKQWGDKYDVNLQNAVNMASTMGFDLESQQDMASHA